MTSSRDVFLQPVGSRSRDVRVGHREVDPDGHPGRHRRGWCRPGCRTSNVEPRVVGVVERHPVRRLAAEQDEQQGPEGEQPDQVGSSALFSILLTISLPDLDLEQVHPFPNLDDVRTV
jgi:hypothetical protein